MFETILESGLVDPVDQPDTRVWENYNNGHTSYSFMANSQADIFRLIADVVEDYDDEGAIFTVHGPTVYGEDGYEYSAILFVSQ